MKRLGVLIIFLLTTVQLFAQTQYDYYEGRDAYGGVDTAITGFKIIGIIVLIVFVIFIIAAIYGFFAGWFKKEENTNNGVQKRNIGNTTVNNIQDEKQRVVIPQEEKADVKQINKNLIQGNAIEIIQLIDLAKKGDCEAQAQLGLYYVDEKNYEEGILWLDKAAKRGNARAQNAMGFCFQQGWGVPRDYVQAVVYFREAADNGNVAAQRHLALCYEFGLGISQNLVHAFKWMSEAAKHGNCQAQISLGEYYEKGIGVDVNLDESLNWYYKAASKGDAQAIECVKRITSQMPKEDECPTETTSGNDFFTDEYGVVYSSDGKTLISCSKQDIGDYRVKDGCEIIQKNAFCMNVCGRGCSLYSIYLPNSVVSIEDSAFAYCSELTCINSPNSLVSIGDNAFEFCAKLSEIVFPSNLIKIGCRAFFGCNKFTSITFPPHISTIEEESFGACTNLSQIIIPEGVQRIGPNAFFLCKSIMSISFPKGLTMIDKQAFASCDSLFSITFLDFVTYIDQEAFRWCRGLKEVHIPNGTMSYFRKIIPANLQDRLNESFEK